MAPRGFDCCNPGNAVSAVIKQHQQSAQLSQHEFVTMTQKPLPPPAAPAAVLQTHTRFQALAGHAKACTLHWLAPYPCASRLISATFLASASPSSSSLPSPHTPHHWRCNSQQHRPCKGWGYMLSITCRADAWCRCGRKQQLLLLLRQKHKRKHDCKRLQGTTRLR